MGTRLPHRSGKATTGTLLCERDTAPVDDDIATSVRGELAARTENVLLHRSAVVAAPAS